MFRRLIKNHVKYSAAVTYMREMNRAVYQPIETDREPGT